MTTNVLKNLPTFSLAFLLALLVGCASTSTSSSTGQYIDDSTITAKVKTALINDPAVKAGEINVETFKGVVSLSGFVSSQTGINRAVELARGVEGVKSVKNDMRLRAAQ
jgi:osmotically-inducible protein OsmY